MPVGPAEDLVGQGGLGQFGVAGPRQPVAAAAARRHRCRFQAAAMRTEEVAVLAAAVAVVAVGDHFQAVAAWARHQR